MNLNLGVFLDLATVDNSDLDLAALDRSMPRWSIRSLTAPGETAKAIADADLVVTNKVIIDREAIAAAPQLKLIVVAATGTNVVDLEAARERDITVCNVRDYCGGSLAQHVLTLMLNLVSGQPWYARRAIDGDWSESGKFSLHDRPIRELSSLSLGIIGYGALGGAVADMARAIGMNVLIGERRGLKTRSDRLSFADLVGNADVVSVHTPLTPNTLNMFDAEVFRAMKNDAILINAARGGIVNEPDLVEALRAGEIGGAGVDCLTEEPPPADHPLLADDIPNLIVTPHNAWASARARQACIDQVASVIKCFQRGQPLNRVV